MSQNEDKQTLNSQYENGELSSNNRVVKFLAKHNISPKEMIVYVFLFLLFSGIIVWKLLPTKDSNINIAPIEISGPKDSTPLVDYSTPWSRYITTTSKEAELKEVISVMEDLSSLDDVHKLLQTSLESHQLQLGFVSTSDYYGSESKAFSETEVEHLKTFGIVLLDELYKYPNGVINTVELNSILLSNGTLNSGKRTGLNGLADYESNTVIYNATTLLTESKGRQQYNPTWERYVRQLIQHEIGHFTHNKLGLTNTNYPSMWGRWSRINSPGFSYLMSCESSNPLAEAAAPIPEGFVTANATTCPAEDWADTYAAVMGRGGIAGTPRDEFFKAKELFVKDKLIGHEPSFEQAFNLQ